VRFGDLWPGLHDHRTDEPIVPKSYGPKKVSVPEACFKICANQDGNGIVAFLGLHHAPENAAGHSPKSFLHSIRDVERRTGLNFFSSLSQAQQERLN